MVNNPLISVVIPVYNSGYLTETISSVLEQTWQEIEVIVVDDGSETDLFPVIERSGSEKVKYYKLPHSNANVARNFGIKMSKGEYIAMLDADDRWMKDHLEQCIRALWLHGADGVYGGVVLERNNQLVYARELHQGESMINYLLRTGYGAQTSTLFMTAASAQQIEWDPSLLRHQDYDFVVKYHCEFKWAAKPVPSVIYRNDQGVKKIDFWSCIRCMGRYQEEVDPDLYNAYCLNMLQLARLLNVSADVVLFYQSQIRAFR